MDWKQYYIQGLELLYFCTGSYFDVKDKEIPNWFLLVFLVAAFLCNIFGDYQSFFEMLAGIFVGAGFLLICWLSKEAMGYGDGIALITLGIFEGGRQMFPIVFWAFFMSGIYGGWKLLILKKQRRETMPFVPFLLFAFLGVKGL